MRFAQDTGRDAELDLSRLAGAASRRQPELAQVPQRAKAPLVTVEKCSGQTTPDSWRLDATLTVTAGHQNRKG